MSLASNLRSTRTMRGIAAAAVVLATGGLILARASLAAPRGSAAAFEHATPGTENVARFYGPGAHGQVALSDAKVLAGNGSLFAEVRITADEGAGAFEPAPLALVLVLDTSGSMEGEKMDRAKDSVLALMHDMRDDDEVAFVRYSSEAELVQPLARMSAVRRSLAARVRGLEAGGGTNIPSGLSMGLKTLAGAEPGRVRRVVLVSDGLDSTRAEAERLASDNAERGITISSMGIGLDFDEAYMSSVARAGHGNFRFVNDGAALAAFLHRELDEASKTTVENATVRLTLPRDVRFVRASGVDAHLEGGAVVLKMGSLFAGDERRGLLQLSTSIAAGETRDIAVDATWHAVGGKDADLHAITVGVSATGDEREVQRGEDEAVMTSWTSVTSSQRELEAAQAYAHGDKATANALIDQNIDTLSNQMAVAPPQAAAALKSQIAAYSAQRKTFEAAPSSDEGKRAAKSATVKETSNLVRSAY